MRNFKFFCIFFTFFACACEQQDFLGEVDPDNAEELLIIQDAQQAHTFLQKENTAFDAGDPYEILSVKLDNETLRVRIQYSGGCTQHRFRLHWEGLPNTDSSAEIPLILSHDAQGDLCEALITDTLNINLKKVIGDTYDPNKHKITLINAYKYAQDCGLTGTIRDKTGLDGCGFMIELEDGSLLNPVEIADKGLVMEDGLLIHFSYQPFDGDDVCMAGKSVKITCIQEQRVEGIIRDKTGLDGCGFMIELEDGSLLNPIEIENKDFVMKDGLAVSFSYQTLDDVADVCMAGPAVKVTHIQKKD